jgi:heavy metal sensor kinase
MNKFWTNLRSVRWRITLWFTFVLALTLVIFSATVYFAMRQALNTQLETSLQDGTLALAENLEHEFEEGDAVPDAAAALVRESSFRNLAIEIYDQNGTLLAASSDITEPTLAAKLDLGKIPILGNDLARGKIRDSKFDPAGFKIAAVRIIHPATKEMFSIVAGGRKSVVAGEMATLRNQLLTYAPLLLLLAAGGGFYLAGRAMKPVAEMAAQARAMNANRLSERLTAADSKDELGQLAATFNELFDRIESAFGQMRQFIADASHELRTPVTVIRTETDVALTEPRTETEAFASLEIIRDESTRLSRLVEDMFTLARADADDRNIIKSEPVLLAELVDTCARSAETLGRSRNIRLISVNKLPPDFVCLGDRVRLAQMLLNLLDNASKYTPADGTVTINAALENHQDMIQAVISIADNGNGIPAEFREQVFTRFYRMDKARTRAHGGSGLGLPIARAIAEAHRGTLSLEDNSQSGCVFKIMLPASQIQ